VPLRILAIDPGTRELGYAVLEGSELLHFGVHPFAHRLSATDLEDAGRQFLRALVETFAPQGFVIEHLVSPQSRRSARIPAFIRAMKRFATKHRRYVLSFRLAMVKIAIVGDDTAPQRAVAETLVRQGYPCTSPGISRSTCARGNATGSICLMRWSSGSQPTRTSPRREC